MRTKLLAVLLLVSACGGSDPVTQRLDGGLILRDGAEFSPEITSLKATPSQVTAGVATPVTWTWTYKIDPTFPMPTCTLDNGVGAVTNGQMTMLTLTQVTLFTLTCTNNQGMASRQAIVSVPPVSPILSTFTVTPTTIAANTAQNYTFTWSYSNTPSPTPTCYVDGASASPMASGSMVSLNLPQARTFRLRCTNSASGGAAVTADATVQVTECGTASAECNPNSTCTDTVNGYTCTCANGFTPAAWVTPPSTSTTNSAMGDTCYFNANGAGSCDANATFNASGYCQCNPGYVGSGSNGDCARARIAFTTSGVGNGQILNGSGAWTGGSGATGLAWADSICTARAAAATPSALPGTYKAWLSDATDDAYCRIAGFSGKKSANCGQGALPTAGGPWIRLGDKRPFAPRIDKLAQGVTYYPSIYSEAGTAVPTTQKIWTGTDAAGVYTGNSCSDWGSSSSSFKGSSGLAFGGSSTWTRDSIAANDPACNATAALLCMEVASGSGPALPPRHPTSSKKAFLTSVSGNGALSTWPDAHGVTGTHGYQQADEICKSRARYAGYASSASYKAWFSPYASSITSRLLNFSPFYRPDGVVLGSTYSDMFDRQLNASFNMTETNVYEQGTADGGLAWTGSMTYSGSYGSSGYVCASSYTVGWTSGSSSYTGVLGKFGITDERYTGGGFSFSTNTGSCDTVARLYCVED